MTSFNAYFTVSVLNWNWYCLHPHVLIRVETYLAVVAHWNWVSCPVLRFHQYIPMTTVVLLGFLRCAHCPGLLVLGAFWTTSCHDYVPSDDPFWRITVTRLLKTVMKTTELKMLRTSRWLCTSPSWHSKYRSHAWNTWSRHELRWFSLYLSPSLVLSGVKMRNEKKKRRGVLKKGLKFLGSVMGYLKMDFKIV
jgi:hypothetical protein